jgi:hypothetical protein
VTWLALLFYWVAYFPGLFSPDSLTYIVQVSTSSWTTQHSVGYDALVWLSLRTTGDLAPLTFVQTVVAAAGLTYAAAQLHRLGISRVLLAVVSIVVAATPSVGEFVVCVWKDVAYVVAGVFLIGTLARITDLHRRPRASVAATAATAPAAPRIRPRLWWLLIAELLAVALTRPDGFIVVALTGAGLVLVWPGLRWRAAAVAAGATVVALGAMLVLFPALGVTNVTSSAGAGLTSADLAVLYAEHPRYFTSSDRTVLTSVAPLAVWQNTAYCHNSDLTTTATGFNDAAAVSHLSDLTSLWLRQAAAHPVDVLAIRLCRGSVAWLPYQLTPRYFIVGNPVNGPGWALTNWFRSTPYGNSVYSRPLLPYAHRVALRLHAWATVSWAEPILWRGSTWAYLTYVALIAAAVRRRSLALLGLGAPTVANQIAVLVLSPAPEARYMFTPLVLGPLLACVAFVSTSPRSEPDAIPAARRPEEPASASSGNEPPATPAGSRSLPTGDGTGSMPAWPSNPAPGRHRLTA